MLHCYATHSLVTAPQSSSELNGLQQMLGDYNRTALRTVPRLTCKYLLRDFNIELSSFFSFTMCKGVIPTLKSEHCVLCSPQNSEIVFGIKCVLG